MTITLQKLLTDLLGATYSADVNVTLRTPDGESFDFPVTDTGYDAGVNTFDLFVDMPADAPIKHPPAPRELGALLSTLAEVWLVEHDPITQQQIDAGAYPQEALGMPEWSVSDGPPGSRSYSEDFHSFDDALRSIMAHPRIERIVIDRLPAGDPVRSPDAATPMPRKVWSSGWNIPGYIPDDEPMNFDTWIEAWKALVEALEQARDQALEDRNLGSAHADVEINLYSNALGDLYSAAGETDWCRRVGNYMWWVQQITLPADA